MGPGNYSVWATSEVVMGRWGTVFQRNAGTNMSTAYQHCTPYQHTSQSPMVQSSNHWANGSELFMSVESAQPAGLKSSTAIGPLMSYWENHGLLKSRWPMTTAQINFPSPTMAPLTYFWMKPAWFKPRSQNQHQQTCQSCQSLWIPKCHQRTS